MVVWVGGLIFFAFVVAPTAFHVMGTTRQFAVLIDGSLYQLNRLGHLAASFSCSPRLGCGFARNRAAAG